MKKKNVFLCLLLALSLVCNLSVLSASATSQKDKITLNNLPAYSGEAYVELNDNVPSFSKKDIIQIEQQQKNTSASIIRIPSLYYFH